MNYNDGVNEIVSTTPYMLRNDGALLKCGSVHPYIKLYYEDSWDKALEDIDDEDLQWYFDNTLNYHLRDCIKRFRRIKSLELLKEINDLSNQEFCKVRTSNHKYKYGGDNGEIYFRICSKGFNWFDIIWNTVLRFKDFIKDVTVMRDFATFGKQFDYCYIKGNPVKHMDINEFLALPGNPQVE